MADLAIYKAAEAYMELAQKKWEIEREMRDISQNPEVLFQVAGDRPDCITVNWRRLANKRFR